MGEGRKEEKNLWKKGTFRGILPVTAAKSSQSESLQKGGERRGRESPRKFSIIGKPDVESMKPKIDPG